MNSCEQIAFLQIPTIATCIQVILHCLHIRKHNAAIGKEKSRSVVKELSPATAPVDNAHLGNLGTWLLPYSIGVSALYSKIYKITIYTFHNFAIK